MHRGVGVVSFRRRGYSGRSLRLTAGDPRKRLPQAYMVKYPANTFSGGEDVRRSFPAHAPAVYPCDRPGLLRTGQTSRTRRGPRKGDPGIQEGDVRRRERGRRSEGIVEGVAEIERFDFIRIRSPLLFVRRR